MNLNILGDLARNSTNSRDEFTVIVQEGGAFADALRDAQADTEKEQRLALGKVLGSVITTITSRKQDLIKHVRAHRSAAKQAQQRLRDIDKAWAYAQDTENFVPLAKSLDMAPGSLGLSYIEFDALDRIPSDWAPPAPVINVPAVRVEAPAGDGRREG